MKLPLCHLALLAAAAVAIAACKRKAPTPNAAQEPESAPPPAEQAAAAASMPEEAPAGSPATAKAAAPSEPPTAAETPIAALTPTAGNVDFEVWFKHHKLDLNDAQMLDADPDADGASNRDEFLADTDPHDPSSRPGIHKTIRLAEYQEMRLPIVVESVEGGKARIRHTDAPGKTELVKSGDTLQGLPLKVAKVQEVHDTDKNGQPIDRSTVALEDADTKERLTLVKDMPARTAGSFATLTSADGKTTLKVRQGETFKWPGDEAATYKVIDLREDQVVLQQLETKKTWTVTRAPAAAAVP